MKTIQENYSIAYKNLEELFDALDGFAIQANVESALTNLDAIKENILPKKG